MASPKKKAKRARRAAEVKKRPASSSRLYELHYSCSDGMPVPVKLTPRTIEVFRAMKAAEEREGRDGMLRVFAQSELWAALLKDAGGFPNETVFAPSQYMIGSYLAWKMGKRTADLRWIHDDRFRDDFARIVLCGDVELELDLEAEAEQIPGPSQDDFLSTLSKPRRKFALPI